MMLYLVMQNAYQPMRPFTRRELTTFRVSNSSFDGIRVVDIANDDHAASRLLGAQELVFADMTATKVSLRILWPGYEPYSHQFNVRCVRNGVPTGFTVEQMANALAREVVRAFKTLSSWQWTPDGWHLELDGIRIEQIFLLGVDRVSRGSIQPVIAVGIPQTVGLLDSGSTI